MNNVEELDVYQRSLKLSNEIWDICLSWEYFAKKTVGDQLVRAMDSISANLAEGKGRYSIKENIHFCFYARGSIEEVKDWLRKSYSRKLINESQNNALFLDLTIIAKQLNSYINSLKNKANRQPPTPNTHHPGANT